MIKGGVAIIDGHSHVYRHFFGKPARFSPSGMAVHAVQGWVEMYVALVREHSPRDVFAVFDPSEKREVEPGGYKAHRPPTPEGLEGQVQMVKRVVRALGARVVTGTVEDEGDQIIASILPYISGHTATIYSADKDMAQLVGDGVTWARPKGGGWDIFYRESVHAKFGVYPEQFADYLLLVGDAADNLPGVKGIGPVAAAKFLRESGSIAAGLYSGLKGLGASQSAALRADLPALEERRKIVQLRPRAVAIPESEADLTLAFDLLRGMGLGSLALRTRDFFMRRAAASAKKHPVEA